MSDSTDPSTSDANTDSSRCPRPRVLVPFVVWIAYLLLGSLVFVSIEGPNEKRSYEEKLEALEDVLNATCFADTMDASGIRNMSEDILAQLYPYKDVYHWDYVGGIHFCLTVISTIGFGTLTPSTQVGRFLCIVYGFFGILINVVFMSRVGRLITMFIDHLYDRLVTLYEAVLTRFGCAGCVQNPSRSTDPVAGGSNRSRPTRTSKNHVGCKPYEDVHYTEYTLLAPGQISVGYRDALRDHENDFETNGKNMSMLKMCPNGTSQAIKGGHGLERLRQDSLPENQSHNPPGKSNEHEGSDSSKKGKASVYFLIFCVLVYINIVSLALFLFFQKGLSYIDTLYIQFITFSTIGFGDSFSMFADFLYLFDIEPAGFLTISLVNILLGMAAISTVISYVTETNRVEEARKELKKWLCGSSSKQTNETRVNTATNPTRCHARETAV